MLSFTEALKRVLDGVEPLGAERVGLRAAAGRVLARDVVAGSPLPRFDYSAMDGYAVHSRDFEGPGPWRLPLTAENRAGMSPEPLARGGAARIFTGALIPSGADAVVAQEDTRAGADGVTFELAPPLGQHIRRRGEDLAEGATALRAGTRLGPHQLGLAAALDQVELLVARRPRVSIISTGDELRAVGRPGPIHTIPESNGLSVAIESERVGARAELAELAGDDTTRMAASFTELLGATDVLVTIGGVSVGDYDLVRPALEAAGARLDFWRVQIKPGRPLAFGRCGKTRILGLPGNPASAQLTFLLFGIPLLRALQGERATFPRFHEARLLQELRQKPGRLGFYRGVLGPDGVEPLGNQASGSVVGLSEANALIAVPAESHGYGAGEVVQILRLDEL